MSVYCRDLSDGQWAVYQHSSGRLFYHCAALQRSNWKPPRHLKPARDLRTGAGTEITAPVPPGYVQLCDAETGKFIYTMSLSFIPNRIS